MATDKKILWVILIMAILMYHGCAIKAQRMKEIKQCVPLKKISQQQYEFCKKDITYFSVFADFKTVFSAMD